jgi:hypothetical protein
MSGSRNKIKGVAMSVPMGSTLKKQVHELIDRLPGTCTTEDIHYQLYLIDKIHRGEAALKKGGIAHKQVRKRAAAWARK